MLCNPYIFLNKCLTILKKAPDMNYYYVNYKRKDCKLVNGLIYTTSDYQKDVVV